MKSNGILFFLSVVILSGLVTVVPTFSGEPEESGIGNVSERSEWFQDLGLGMFIHWSVDSQLGSVISHSMVGASEEYLQRFIHELPAQFYPNQFNPEDWARLAKLAGMKYVVFTTKHHSGFCMFETKTTDFNCMNTPYGRDITRQIVDAFREQGIAIGFYFSPDDFWMLHRQGLDISRRRPEALPARVRLRFWDKADGFLNINPRLIRKRVGNRMKAGCIFPSCGHNEYTTIHNGRIRWWSRSLMRKL